MSGQLRAKCLRYDVRMPATFSLVSSTVAGPSWPGMRMFTTTRGGGVSQPPFATLNLADHVGDSAADVARNRSLVRTVLPGEPCWLNQVHGKLVHDADADADADASRVPVADAAITAAPRRVLAILTADCLPVVIGAADASVLAVAHAGWRGLADGVLDATVAALARHVDVAALRAWIGPAIGPAAFEVGGDVLDAFRGEAPEMFVAHAERPDKWWGNLPALAARRLQRLGVGAVEQSRLCTVKDERFFSYRRDGRTGRCATFAWLTGE